MSLGQAQREVAGRGRGERLVERGADGRLLHVDRLDLATDLKAEWLTLEVRASNFPAQRLYEKYGFHAAGIRRRYYSDNDEDAIIMWTERLRDRAVRDRLAKLRAQLEED